MDLKSLYAAFNKPVVGTIAIRRKHLTEGQALHLRRYLAEVRYTAFNSRAIPAVFFSLDLSPRSLRIMTPEVLQEGAVIAVTFEDNQRVYALARVRWSKLYKLSRRMMGSQHAYDFRSELEFLTGSPAEAKALSSFWAEINRTTKAAGRG